MDNNTEPPSALQNITNTPLVKCEAVGPYIGVDGRVWPCCYVHCDNLSSKKIEEYSLADKDLNSLRVKYLKDICQHEAFTKHYNYQDFCDSNNIDPICLENCKI